MVLVKTVKNIFTPQPDPLTGDLLNFPDRVSWFAQGIIRRWTWVIINLAFSAFWWHQFWSGFKDPTTLWMALYSLMAIIVESIVGIGQFQQGKRDAILLRQVFKVVDSTQTILTHVETLLERIAVHEEHIEDLQEDILEQI